MVSRIERAQCCVPVTCSYSGSRDKLALGLKDLSTTGALICCSFDQCRLLGSSQHITITVGPSAIPNIKHPTLHLAGSIVWRRGIVSRKYGTAVGVKFDAATERMLIEYGYFNDAEYPSSDIPHPIMVQTKTLLPLLSCLLVFIVSFLINYPQIQFDKDSFCNMISPVFGFYVWAVVAFTNGNQICQGGKYCLGNNETIDVLKIILGIILLLICYSIAISLSKAPSSILAIFYAILAVFTWIFPIIILNLKPV